MLAASGALQNCVDVLPIFQQWCLSDTHIMSDGWAAYNNVAQINGEMFLHDVAVHQHNFVDPNNADIHTQNIEYLWMRAKRKLRRQFGTTRALFDTYLEEFMWQERNKDHRQRLDALLFCIREQYPYNWRRRKKPKGSFQSQPFVSQKSCLLLVCRALYVQLLYLARQMLVISFK